MGADAARRAAGGGMTARIVCLHGVESTGKSTLAPRLAARFNAPWVAEYGREYAEAHGLDFSPDDLMAMAQGQQGRIAAAARNPGRLVIADTDALMTAAWHRMLFGTVPDTLMRFPKADLYLLFDKDVPWVDDGTRFFGTAERRAAFDAASRDMLDRAGVRWLSVSGDWAARQAKAIAAIEMLLMEE